MNLRQLEFFAAVAREGHFGRAAAACHVTQPALSLGIRRLEDELGVRLLHRGAGRTGLTEAGRLLVPRARAAVAEAAGLAEAAGALRGTLTATLRLGVMPTAVAVVPALLAPLLRDQPGVRVEVRTRPLHDMTAEIRQHELDAGLAYVDEPVAGLRAEPLYEERLVLVRVGDDDGADGEPVPWREAAALDLCLLTEEMAHRALVDAAFASAGVAVRPRLEADSFAVLLGLLRAGWPTIVGHTWLLRQGLPDDVRVRPLVDPVVAPRIGLLTPDDALVAPVTAALRSTLAGVDLAPPTGGG